MCKGEPKRIVIEIIKIIIFLISCAFIASSYLHEVFKMNVGNSSNNLAFLFLFIISACIETLSGFDDDYNLSKGVKKINIAEISLGVFFMTCGIFFVNLDTAFSLLGLICVVIYFGLKSYRLYKIFYSYVNYKTLHD